MPQLIEKYRIHISITALIAIIIWIAVTSRIVTAKEEHLKQLVQGLELKTNYINSALAKFEFTATKKSEDLNTVMIDVSGIKSDITNIKQTLSRLETKVDKL